MRRPDEGLILQPVRVFARPRPKADIGAIQISVATDSSPRHAAVAAKSRRDFFLICTVFC